VDLLESYGIDAHVEHADVSTLDRYLQEGRSIILAVDSDELRHDVDKYSSVAGRMADHAVVISRIDVNAGVAFLQDPAHPGGQGYEVSLDALEDAWADSANGMVVTDLAASDVVEARGAVPADASGVPSAEHDPRTDERAERIRASGPAGAVILPVLLGGRAVIRRQTRA
jgi:hypothetical protein